MAKDETSTIPKHVVIIPDGNRRWAKKRGLAPIDGHKRGLETALKIVKGSRNLGVHTLTLWGFSTENWKRPSKEKSRIFDIIYQNLKHELKTAHEEKVRLVH